MPKRKKQKKVNVKNQKIVDLARYRKDLDQLKTEGKSEYSPKVGRQIHKLEKKIKKAA